MGYTEQSLGVPVGQPDLGSYNGKLGRDPRSV